MDDTGFLKKGTHSAGVARPYCGQVGKQDNRRVAVGLSVATCHASLPIAWRLYLPESWANDRDRRKRAGIPDAISFRTEPAIALAQIRRAEEQGVPGAPVLVKELLFSLPAHAWEPVTWRTATKQNWNRVLPPFGSARRTGIITGVNRIRKRGVDGMASERNGTRQVLALGSAVTDQTDRAGAAGEAYIIMPRSALPRARQTV